ncbi:alpha/beta hydrolase [Streptomyces kasugaensis]|uniref:Alpha/beta hydrolase n=1 Tax=Streptomyces kasugaensis TaxID=1946 RepID=A0A4Q9HMT3_STRKA|nr:alpha/beta hydrolase [Streptomyces kasugaensis]TBO56126.1 alpha/beta hydrolase [Streptomyces kasugaensis]
MDPALEALAEQVARLVPRADLGWPEPWLEPAADRTGWAARVAELRAVHNRRVLDGADALAKAAPPVADPADGAEAAAADVREVTIEVAGGTISAQLHLPRGNGPFPAVVHFHGGGFWTGDGAVLRRLDGALCARLSARLTAVVVNVDYRLAPEHKFPQPVEDGYAAVRWLAGHAAEFGVDPGRIAVSGVSAGGTIAAAVCLLARDRAAPSIRFQALLAPALDLSVHLQSEPGGFRDEFRRCIDLYVALWQDRRDPLVSPVHAEDLSGLPDAFIGTGSHDPLRDPAELYGLRLARAGVAATVRRYPATHTVALPETQAARTADLFAALDAALRTTG